MSDWFKVAEFIINLMVGMGTLALAYLAYKEIIWKHKENRPMVDIRIEVNDRLPLLIIENVGDIPAEGTAYMFIQPQTEDKNIKNSIINDSKVRSLKKSEFNEYLFAKFDFSLKPKENTKYNYPFQSYLEDAAGKQDMYHFIRIDYSYKGIGHEENFDYVSNYHMLPPIENVNHWIASKVNTNMKFKKYIRDSDNLPKYDDYLNMGK